MTKRRFTQAEREAAAARAKAARAKKRVKTAVDGSKGASAVRSAGAAVAAVPGGVPDYFGDAPNWGNSPSNIRKFMDSLPLLNTANNLGQMLPVAVPDTTTYPGSDYYEIELIQYEKQMHRDLPPTTLRGYRQTNITPLPQPHYLGPIIVATKNRPVRIKFTNNLPPGADGKLFLPVDTTIMGSGPGPSLAGWTGEQAADDLCYSAAGEPTPAGCYTENRGTIHLHGGKTPWISDGTPHQWIVPATDSTVYKKGDSVYNVPDMPDPGPGSQTYYYTNQQSARLMFYHDHASGLTRLNVYAGEAAGYLITDPTEQKLVNVDQVIPADQIPLIIQDKTFVDAATIRTTDPTWNSGTGALDANGIRAPKRGDLWWPHVYVPAQNPGDIEGVNPMGRWVYGPWFWPPTTGIRFGPVPNPNYDPSCNPFTTYCQPELMPGTPNVSWGAEAFLDVPVVNGTVFPYLEVQPRAYRFRVLNAAHDRFWNLQLYVADEDPTVVSSDGRTLTEVKMVPAIHTPTFPPLATVPDDPRVWPTDGREGGVPDPLTAGPDWIYIGTEGGFLPEPVVVPTQPVGWNNDPTTFNAGNVQDHSLLLGPAERADVIVDFSKYAGKTLILYNDAPAAFPALDPRLDYYTGAPDMRDTGGVNTPQIGFAPNTRTIMQIRVGGTAGQSYPAYNLDALKAAWNPTTGPGVFASSQDPIVVGQYLYNTAYQTAFPFAPPYWGVSNIESTSLSFGKVGGGTMTIPMEPKAIQDEMGEVFDEYGRMNAKLGLELNNTNAQIQNFTMQAYWDPPTEIIKDSVTAGPPVAGDGTQIWKVTHNGVDTHPVHFHIFDVQLINRVGWDGAIRLPHPTELGWKDTVRISPLEDTIVALRPVAPKLPFGIPDSVRKLNPALPSGATEGFTNVDPYTGQPLTTPTINTEISLGWEYVWHCHILSHEESDMMRPIKLDVAVSVPQAPVLSRLGTTLPVNLSWTDATPVGSDPAAPLNLGNPRNEVGFRVERAVVTGTTTGPYTVLGQALANKTTFADPTADAAGTYRYRVVAFNAAGSAVSNLVTVTSTTAPPAAPTNLNLTLQTAPLGVRLTWTDNSTNETGFRVHRSTNNAFTANLEVTNLAAGSTTHTDTNVVDGTTYWYRVMALNGTVMSAPTNVRSITATTVLAAPSNLRVTVLTGPQVRLTWNDNSTGETGFVVERALASDFSGTVTSLPAVTLATATDTGVQAGNTYYYRVRATGTNPSAYSNVAVAGPPTAPINLVVSRVTTGVRVAFADTGTLEQGYRIERSVDGQPFALRTNLTGARSGTVAFTDTQVQVGQVLRYQVRAYNALGDSAWLVQPAPGLTVQ